MNFLFILCIFSWSLLYCENSSYRHYGIIREVNNNLYGIIKELTNHLYYIKNLYSKYRTESNFCHDSSSDKNVLNSYGHFTHPDIKAIIPALNNQKNIVPLIALWQRFIQTPQSIENHEVFLHEVGMLIFLVYNSLLNRVENERIVTPQKKPQTLYEAISLFKKIYVLPIGQLVVVLNDIRQELIVIMQEYPLKENQSIMGWLREYWWLPPTLIAGIVASIILKD